MHFSSAREWVLFTVKELLESRVFYGFVQYPVAFSELMASFRVTAHLRPPLSAPLIPEMFSLFVLFFKRYGCHFFLPYFLTETSSFSLCAQTIWAKFEFAVAMCIILSK